LAIVVSGCSAKAIVDNNISIVIIFILLYVNRESKVVSFLFAILKGQVARLVPSII